MSRYKGDRPILVIPRPWWRHPVFPWGFYSLRQDDFAGFERLFVDGYASPNDDGSALVYWDPEPTGPENGGSVITGPWFHNRRMK